MKVGPVQLLPGNTQTRALWTTGKGGREGVFREWWECSTVTPGNRGGESTVVANLLHSFSQRSSCHHAGLSWRCGRGRPKESMLNFLFPRSPSFHLKHIFIFIYDSDKMKICVCVYIHSFLVVYQLLFGEHALRIFISLMIVGLWALFYFYYTEFSLFILEFHVY